MSAIAVLLAFTGCGRRTEQPLSRADTLRYRECSQDSECVYVTNGCCDCANGGEDMAINASLVSEFRDNFSCSFSCTLRGAIPPCGSGTVACKAGFCEYTVP